MELSRRAGLEAEIPSVKGVTVQAGTRRLQGAVSLSWADLPSSWRSLCVEVLCVIGLFSILLSISQVLSVEGKASGQPPPLDDVRDRFPATPDGYSPSERFLRRLCVN